MANTLSAQMRSRQLQCVSSQRHRTPAFRTVCSSQPATRHQPSPALATSRREFAKLSLASLIALGVSADAAQAAGRSVLRKKVPVEDYSVSEVNGLKTYDLLEGKGNAVAEGTSLVVHWDVLYKGVSVVSSRLARTLGGNRTIAEPFSFVAGESVAYSSVAGSPKPPPALSTAVIGMKEGGIRSVIVDNPALGYRSRMQEIPAGDEFELRIEVLDVRRA